MIKNIEKGFKRTAIILWILWAIILFNVFPTYFLLPTNFFKACVKGLGCDIFSNILWTYIQWLSYPLIIFFVIAFIWKGFKGKSR